MPQAALPPRTPPLAPARATAPPAHPRHAALVGSAARLLGLTGADLAQVTSSGLLRVGAMTVMLIPLPDTADGRLGLLCSVDSGHAQAGEGPLAASSVLQHASGSLVSFNASIGLSADGHWLLHRQLSLDAGDGRVLADAVLVSTRLTDFVLGSPAPAGH